ncbi:HD family phosphohydrolase [Tepiditoga spiralis]|uniref:HD family phosphohydrolase n=1 Tax=Tepiditoga spiralis TaxID=2108365 RepID=A0A7G1GBE9_9BACT|nr:HD domain-containing protein [Tepiditoga spiralis]BBE31029.1 HD family phosphohydrolase [Tepiditoga spiralis]
MSDGVNLGDLFERNNLINETLYVKDLKPNENITIEVKLISKRLQEARDGKKFLLMTLGDKTGVVRAVDRFHAEEFDSTIKIGSIINVTGKVVMFDNRLQLNVSRNEDSVILIKEEDINSEKFLNSNKNNINELQKKLLSFINSINDKKIKKLLEDIFINDEKIKKDFFNSPAAMTVHHAYKGGLIAHTLKVTELALKISETYKNVNKDVLIAGALLHDIGKIYEYEVKPYGIEKTSEGELFGHINIGSNLVMNKSKKIAGLKKEYLDEIIHIILSHHGEIEYGSPILPKTIESLIVHFADNIDSKIQQSIESMNNTLMIDNDASWTDFNKRMGRKFKINKQEEL